MKLTVRLVRWGVAAVVLLYGLAKLGVFGPPQFVYDWQTATFHRDDPHAFTMIWYFYGFSRTYGLFISACEIIPALLLLVPRTATLGAAGIFVVMLNVTVMDWTFGLPTPAALIATGLCVASGFLLWTDRRKLAALIAK